jgi:GNAT superfamily N-acetyltransferase
MPASGAGEVDVAVRDGQALASMLDEVIAVYRAVFCAPPYHEDDRRVAEFIERLGQDAQRPRFTAWTATTRRTGQLVGFATAWPTPQPFPTGRAYDKVAHQLFPRRLRDWLVGALEVDELAVLPAAQGQGIGTRLLNAASKATPDRRAWLLTWAYAPGAVRFYRRRGWHQITDPPPGSSGVVVFLSPDHPGAIAHPSSFPAP